jgi:hypothetical protein
VSLLVPKLAEGFITKNGGEVEVGETTPLNTKRQRNKTEFVTCWLMNNLFWPSMVNQHSTIQRCSIQKTVLIGFDRLEIIISLKGFQESFH